MLRNMLHAKIHRATLSATDLDYAGSMTIPRRLMRRLGILEGEQVLVANLNTGARLVTYAIAGDRPRYFCLNGAAARCGCPGDLLIVQVFALMEEAEARKLRAKVAVMGAHNRLVRIVRA
jgi:aspartate 1-decarboxylase